MYIQQRVCLCVCVCVWGGGGGLSILFPQHVINVYIAHPPPPHSRVWIGHYTCLDEWKRKISFFCCYWGVPILPTYMYMYSPYMHHTCPGWKGLRVSRSWCVLDVHNISDPPPPPPHLKILDLLQVKIIKFYLVMSSQTYVHVNQIDSQITVIRTHLTVSN